MSQLMSIKSNDRFERARAGTVGVICVVAVAFWARDTRVSDVTTFADSYSSLINLILTITLVSVTTFYAWVTYSMARELAEARRAAIRPLIVVNVGYPTITESSDPAVKVAITLSNVGRGHAIRDKVECDAPYEDGDRKTRIVASVTPDLPSMFSPGANHSCTWSVPLSTDFDADRHDFMELDATYEDAEGNVYQLLVSYDLQQFKTFKAFRPNREALFFLPLHRRRALRTISAINENHRAIRLY